MRRMCDIITTNEHTKKKTATRLCALNVENLVRWNGDEKIERLMRFKAGSTYATFIGE